MPLYLKDTDVAALLQPADAVDVIEACFRRMAAGEIDIAPRRRLRLPEGALADMAASDLGLGLAGGKLYAATAEGATFVVCLFDSETSELVAVIEADRLGQLQRVVDETVRRSVERVTSLPAFQKEMRRIERSVKTLEARIARLRGQDGQASGSGGGSPPAGN